MAVILIILKIAIYTFILNVIFRQSYNFIFMLWQKPIVWILVVGILSVANMLLAYSLSWDPRLVSAAAFTTLLLNIPPPAPKSIAKDKLNNFVEDFYTELGIKNGRVKYRIGVAVFAIFSLISYVIFFGEVCRIGDEKCVPLIKTIFT